MLAITACALLVFIAVHLTIAQMRFLNIIPRSRWLSAAGGISVAYVFVHLLPELATWQEVLADISMLQVGFLRHHTYLVALIGLTFFYGLERLMKSQRDELQTQGHSAAVFWIHIGSFAIYNILIGYLLLHREESGLLSLLWYSLAMTPHFVVTDFGLFHDYRELYVRTGRWILMAAVALGWLIGVFTEVSQATLAVLTAFLAGGVILNVLKEELPEERQSRFTAFLLGAAGYTIVLLLT